MPSIIRVSVSEAAQLFGVSTKTIRRAIKNQEVRYIVVRGRYKIQFKDLIEWSQKRSSTRRKRDTEGIGQYVEKWKIKNTLYSPNPEIVKKEIVKTNKNYKEK